MVSKYMLEILIKVSGRVNEEIQNYAWDYSKLNCYALRLYSRGLTEEEVIKNYAKSVEYHSLLEK